MTWAEAIASPHDPYCPVARGEYEDRGGVKLAPPLCRCSHARNLQEAED